MTADSHALAVPHAEEETGHGGGINTALLGMLLFIGSETMFFAGLFGVAYWGLAHVSGCWIDFSFHP